MSERDNYQGTMSKQGTETKLVRIGRMNTELAAVPHAGHARLLQPARLLPRHLVPSGSNFLRILTLITDLGKYTPVWS